MMKSFKFRPLEISLGILFVVIGLSEWMVDSNIYSALIAGISGVLVVGYPFFLRRTFSFWMMSIASLGVFLICFWNLPKIDLWYPIFRPRWEPIIFLFSFTFWGNQFLGNHRKGKRQLFLWILGFGFFFCLFLTFRDQKQNSAMVKNMAEKAAVANYGDPLLSIFDLAEEWSNQPEFWNKYQEQTGWMAWLEEKYFKEKLIGFEIVDFKDSLVSEIKVDLQEGYKTQIFQVQIPRKDSLGISISIERKTTPALLFEESQQTGLFAPEGITMGVFIDEMLQQSQGKAILSPFWKENIQQLQNDQQFLFKTSKNGNRQTIAIMAFDFVIVFWSKFIWSIVISIVSITISNISGFRQRWKTEKRFKIQGVVLGLVLVSAVIFSAYSIQISKKQFHDEILRSKLKEIEKFSVQLRKILVNSDMNDPTTQIRLNRLSRNWEVDFRLTNEKHNSVFQTFFLEQPIQFVEKQSLHENLYQLNHENIRSIEYLIQLPQKNYFFEWFLFNEDASQSQENIGKMIHFLASIMVILIGFSWLVGNWLIRPFITLKNQLIVSGDESLIWKDQDEIGQLVHAYNEVLNKVKKQARSLADQEKELAWKNMAKQVAHEIRNPLTPMKLQLQLLDRMPEGEKKQEQLQKTISILFEQMNSLERISTEFSTFANFPEPKLEPMNIVPVIQSAIDLYSTQAIISFAHPEIVLLRLDREMMMRAIGNLIKNAIQAYGENSASGNITLSLSVENQEATLRIEDWAGGIPEEIQSKVFQPNFTTKSSGMGLGLSLVQRSMDGHGGSIEILNKPTEGCIFLLRFPLSNES